MFAMCIALAAAWVVWGTDMLWRTVQRCDVVGSPAGARLLLLTLAVLSLPLVGLVVMFLYTAQETRLFLLEYRMDGRVLEARHVLSGKVARVALDEALSVRRRLLRIGGRPKSAARRCVIIEGPGGDVIPVSEALEIYPEIVGECERARVSIG